MQVVETIQDLRSWTKKARAAGRSIGFVPTMGALHEGHLSLMRTARGHTESVVVSIFVNPKQFAPHEDLDKYPRPRAQDIDRCHQAGVDVVFYPSALEIYPPGSDTTVEVKHLSRRWEGETRPEHFRGVATVVAKLFNIVDADAAFFGQKDFQQQALIRRLAYDLNLRTEVVTCPTIRDSDGLAMSSRNAYLDASQREAGLAISRSLREVKRLWIAGLRQPQLLQEHLQRNLAKEPRLRVNYAAAVDPDSLEPATCEQSSLAILVAANSGPTRLLDNTLLRDSDTHDAL